MIVHDEWAAFMVLERPLVGLEPLLHRRWVEGPFQGDLRGGILERINHAYRYSDDPMPESAVMNPLYWDNIGRPAIDWLNDERLLDAEPWISQKKLEGIQRRSARRE